MGNSGGGSRSSLLPLLLGLLVLLGGVGAWNHQRNVAAEGEEVRPYRTLSDADLGLLKRATEGEARKSRSRYALAKRRRAHGGGTGATTQARLRDFERVQHEGRALRNLGAQVSEFEATLAVLQTEIDRRAADGDEWELFLRRLLHF